MVAVAGSVGKADDSGEGDDGDGADCRDDWKEVVADVVKMRRRGGKGGVPSSHPHLTEVLPRSIVWQLFLFVRPAVRIVMVAVRQEEKVRAKGTAEVAVAVDADEVVALSLHQL